MTNLENKMVTDPKFQELLERLKRLNLPPDQFALFSSGPMAVRGLREPGDLDVLTTKKLFDELSQKYPVEQSWHGGKIKGIAKDIDVYDTTASPTSAEVLIENADVIGGIRYVRLEDVTIAKRAEGREKDLKDIQIIKEYLNSKE